MTSLTTWRDRLAELVNEGADRRAVAEFIEATGLDGERKAVLWLWFSARSSA